MIRDFTAPSTLGTAASAWFAASTDRTAPAVPRSAATVLLVRDGATGVEAFMLRRQTTMAFAAGMLVFPGGGVDPRDAATDLPWAGPSPQQWGAWLGADPAQASALVCAAVRETFEECGVLLASPDADVDPAGAGRVPGPDPQGWEGDRKALIDHDLALSELLVRRGLVLRSDLLRPWAHWVTPEFEPRRYDTRFFLARVPQDQQARHVGGEAAASGWWPAAQVLRDADAGGGRLMPPTRVSVEELAAAPDCAALLAAGRALAPVVPRLEQVGERLVLRADLPEQHATGSGASSAARTGDR